VRALAQVETWLSRISLRERALIGLALAGASLAGWDALVLRPHGARAAQVREERLQLEQKLASLEQQRDVFETALASDPNAERRARERALETRVALLDGEIRASASGLIPPAEMTRVLEMLLSARPDLRVLRLEGAPPVALLDPAADASAAVGPTAQPIYRHELRLEIEASFAETVEFLRAVEALPWRFFWDELAYEVTRHPSARVRLVLHTFGDREGWIGA
jgi:MSHA biogenesis protein MshJ